MYQGYNPQAACPGIRTIPRAGCSTTSRPSSLGVLGRPLSSRTRRLRFLSPPNALMSFNQRVHAAINLSVAAPSEDTFRSPLPTGTLTKSIQASSLQNQTVSFT
jgi:hypothetical protein